MENNSYNDNFNRIKYVFKNIDGTIFGNPANTSLEKFYSNQIKTFEDFKIFAKLFFNGEIPIYMYPIGSLTQNLKNFAQATVINGMVPIKIKENSNKILTKMVNFRTLYTKTINYNSFQGFIKKDKVINFLLKLQQRGEYFYSFVQNKAETEERFSD